MSDPTIFLAKTDQDTMYYHQAINQPDTDEFRKAKVK